MTLRRKETRREGPELNSYFLSGIKGVLSSLAKRPFGRVQASKSGVLGQDFRQWEKPRMGELTRQNHTGEAGLT